jgi:hypothetical protein
VVNGGTQSVSQSSATATASAQNENENDLKNGTHDSPAAVDIVSHDHANDRSVRFTSVEVLKEDLRKIASERKSTTMNPKSHDMLENQPAEQGARVS